jgi:hypothetical protein
MTVTHKPYGSESDKPLAYIQINDLVSQDTGRHNDTSE